MLSMASVGDQNPICQRGGHILPFRFRPRRDAIAPIVVVEYEFIGA